MPSEVLAKLREAEKLLLQAEAQPGFLKVKACVILALQEVRSAVKLLRRETMQH